MWSLGATAFLALSSTLLSTLPAHAVNVVLSNDDGWAEINIRAFYNSLTASANSVVISAPAIDRSGTGSSDAPPTTLTKPCEFNSCPAGSPATGNNASMPRFNYVNSYPVTSMRYGIQTLSPTYFSSSGGKPDIAVAGPNVGANSGTTVLFSGTVGATTEAAKEGIPAIAFSGTTGSQTGWTSAPETYTLVYASLSTTVTNALTSSNSGAKPYLPSGIWLNVNFPAVSSSGSCNKAGSFRFVLSRINSAGSTTPKDVVTCGNGGRLPTESTVLATKGCYASISVGVATTKGDASESNQAVVLGKLQGILSCLPS